MRTLKASKLVIDMAATVLILKAGYIICGSKCVPYLRKQKCRAALKLYQENLRGESNS